MVSLDGVVRSVSVSGQREESGAHLSIRRPRAHGCPGPGPAFESCEPSFIGTGPAQVGPGGRMSRSESFPGRRGPLMEEQSAWSRCQLRTLCLVGGVGILCGLEAPKGEDVFVLAGVLGGGPPPTAARPPPPEGGGHRCSRGGSWDGLPMTDARQRPLKGEDVVVLTVDLADGIHLTDARRRPLKMEDVGVLVEARGGGPPPTAARPPPPEGGGHRCSRGGSGGSGSSLDGGL